MVVCEKTDVPEFWENVIEAIQKRSDVAANKKAKAQKGKAPLKLTAKTVKKVTTKAIRKAPSPKSSSRSVT